MDFRAALNTRQPITRQPSRTQEALGEVFDPWGVEVLEGIEGVSIELWKPYQSLVKSRMPNATVVADRFHVMKQVNEELDEHRKTEKRAVEKIRNKVEKERVLKGLTGRKYALIKNEEDLNKWAPRKMLKMLSHNEIHVEI